MANPGLIIGIVIVGLLVLTGIIVAIVFIVKGSSKKTSPTTVPAKTTVPGSNSGSRTTAPGGGGTTVPGITTVPGGGTTVPGTTVPGTTVPVTTPPLYNRNITYKGNEWALGVTSDLIYARKTGGVWQQVPGQAVKLFAIADNILALNAAGELYSTNYIVPGTGWARQLSNKNVKSVDIPIGVMGFTVTFLDGTTTSFSLTGCTGNTPDSCTGIQWMGSSTPPPAATVKYGDQIALRHVESSENYYLEQTGEQSTCAGFDRVYASNKRTAANLWTILPALGTFPQRVVGDNVYPGEKFVLRGGNMKYLSTCASTKPADCTDAHMGVGTTPFDDLTYWTFGNIKLGDPINYGSTRRIESETTTSAYYMPSTYLTTCNTFASPYDPTWKYQQVYATYTDKPASNMWIIER